MDFMNQSGHSYQKRAEYGLKFEGLPGKSYETTNSWNSEPQNIEYRTAECRRVESLAQRRRLRRVLLSLF